MWGTRRSLFLCAAGLASAGGCTSPFGPVEPGSSTPIIRAQETARRDGEPAPPVAAPPVELTAGRGPLPRSTPSLAPGDTPLPINLATAFQLAGARPLDVQIAGRQVARASALYDRAKVLWVPNLLFGTDYFAHTGPQQNFAGDILKSTRNTFMAGLGPNVVFSFSDAVYAPLAARQDLRARQAVEQATINDVSLEVAEAYFNVQRARGELAGATIAERYAEDLARRATALAKGLAPPPEENRAKVELARRKQASISAREQWRLASAELARLLRLDPAAVVEPIEPPFLPVTVIDAAASVDELVPIALTGRPELAGQQAVVQATLARLKQEKLRPLVPSLAIRGVSTPAVNTLGYGVFGGGPNDTLKNFSGRFDIDLQLLWEFQALGFGNKARINERRTEYELATLELFRTQDRIAAEVVSAYAQVRAAAERLNQAEPALKEALDLVNKSLEGLGQTRRVGEAILLVVRPQEAVAAVQALSLANSDFFAAVNEYNRAQFRLYRALGHPAQCLAGGVPAVAGTDVVPGHREPEPSSPAPPSPALFLPPLPELPPVEMPVVETSGLWHEKGSLALPASPRDEFRP